MLVVRLCRQTWLLRIFFLNLSADLFKEPVDPVALELPTYFDVVKNPMDVGTVRKRIRVRESRSSKRL